MKFLFTSNSSWNLYNFRKGLIENLLKNKNEIYILAPKDKYTNFLIKMGCKYIEINISDRKINIFNDIYLFIKYLFYFYRIKPKYLFSYTIKPNIYASFAASFFNIKVVNTLSGLGKVFIKKTILIKIIIFLYKISLKKSYKVFFHNDDDLKLFLDLNIINKNNSKVVNGSGVNLKYFQYNKLPNINNNRITFLFVGRLIYEKGISELIEAAKKIFTIYPNVKFNLIGEIKKNDNDYIKKEYIDFLSKKIPLEYIEKKDDIRNYYINCHCVILPSYREGLPKSLIEAGATGRPSLVTNVPGCRHIIENNFNGLLFDAKDSESLFKSIIEFIEIPYEKKVNMAINARKKVVKYFNEKDVISRYLEIIN